jgi:endonuclease/exonuclease/phosphatase family metal-dependent hydrolase
VVVTGDFNEGESSRPYQALFAVAGDGTSLLQDAYRVAHPVRDAAEATFNGFNAGVREGERIDWIACTQQFHVDSAAIDRTLRDGRVASDHFAVTAVLTPVP